ncbi:MAG: hypothetical protein GAK29_04470 [Acinetobacter bereziniae]|uniref:Uncharacterized protein n=1 Tax=Acinetobacter bereziniae TaxID=106648 RepID=A0A833TU78_ACIBZ|nr:MAG: hypothetical protein GAK29_04470 [Acinetobacter bereziniae]
MDIGYLIGLLIIPLAPPIVNLLTTKKIKGFKGRRNLRIKYIVICLIMIFAIILGGSSSNSGGSNTESIAIMITILVYFVCYKVLIKKAFSVSLFDYDSLEDYVKDLAKQYGVKYPIPPQQVFIFGNPPEIELFESIPDWADATKQYFIRVSST